MHFLLFAALASAGIVHVPLVAKELSPEVAAHLSKRGIAEGISTYDFISYQAVVEIGNPPQKVNTCFDTGSPLLWVPGANSSACLEGHCKNTKSFYNVSESSDWKYVKEGANWGGKGFWGTDTVSYSGETLHDFNVYVSKTSFSNNLGIFGQSGHDDPKSSFVKGLANSGKISRAVYSLNAEKPIDWLTPASNGVASNVYYGGFDRAKYQGPLTTIEVDHHGGYAMPLGGFAIQGEKVKLSQEHQVVLDTGGLKMTLPNSTMELLSKKFGGNGEFDGTWKVECGSKPEITYVFGYTEIDVDLSTNVRESSRGGCRIEGVNSAPDSQIVLLTGGPAVISRALIIFDNDRDTITIGKAKYSDESDVIELTGDIPGTVSYKDWKAGKPLPGGDVKVAQSTAQSSTLAVKATSSESEPAPTTEANSGTGTDWCGLYGIFCNE